MTSNLHACIVGTGVDFYMPRMPSMPFDIRHPEEMRLLASQPLVWRVQYTIPGANSTAMRAVNVTNNTIFAVRVNQSILDGSFQSTLREFAISESGQNSSLVLVRWVVVCPWFNLSLCLGDSQPINDNSQTIQDSTFYGVCGEMFLSSSWSALYHATGMVHNEIA